MEEQTLSGCLPRVWHLVKRNDNQWGTLPHGPAQLMNAGTDDTELSPAKLRSTGIEQSVLEVNMSPPMHGLQGKTSVYQAA
eukprot:2941205-Prorocentrum_lima.AAC.1